MPDDSSEQPSSPIENAGQKIKDFFTMGWDKTKWRKAIIVSILVVFLMGFSSMAAWGTALAFYVRSIAEPNPGSSYSGGSGTLYYISGLDPNSVSDCMNKWVSDNVSSSPLKTEGLTFANAGKESNVNPALMLAIAMQESTLGTKGSGPPHNNPFGWDCPPCQHFSSWAESITHVTSRMSAIYLTAGYDTIAKIQTKWAPIGAANDPRNLNSEWRGGVTKAFNSVVSACPALTPPDKSSANTVDINNLASWYYNQGGTNHTGGGSWGPKKGQCYKQGWPKGQTYAKSGCGITSLAMIFKYYGNNVDPYQVGAEACETNSTMGLGPTQVKSLAKKFGLTSHLIADNDMSVATIQKALKNGPLLAQGNPAFGSSGGHFVVIAGDDGSNFIINDPSSSKRGQAGRKVPYSDRGNINRIYYFSK